MEKPKGVDYLIILLVFALTGTTAAFAPRWLMPLTGLEKGTVWYGLVYFLLITPVYQVLLLAYAWIFGKFDYFLAVEKRMWNWIKARFGVQKAESEGPEDGEKL